MLANAVFCPQCGESANDADRFCRSCGHSLPGASGDGMPWAHPIASPDAGIPPDQRSPLVRPLVLGTLLLLAVAIAGVLATGALHSGESKPAAPDPHRVLVSRLSQPFKEAMDQRASLFVAERDFRSAMSEARSKIRSYQRTVAANKRETKRISDANQPGFDLCQQFNNVPCPSPTYPTDPTVPDVTADVDHLRGVASHLTSLSSDVLAVSPQRELKLFYSQLQAAVTAITADATHNADTLTQAITPPESGGENSTGFMNNEQIKTLRREEALPAIRQMNRAAVRLIRLLGRPLANYDVPGGTDQDPSDHSGLV